MINSNRIMNARLLRCKNPNCSNKLKVQSIDADSKPIIFCSTSCFNTLLESEKLNQRSEFEDPNELRQLVRELVAQTNDMKKELENFQKIRKTYFNIFKSSGLKDEVYKRKWSFENEVDK